MKPKVIKTERDYKAAITRVEALRAKSAPDEAELDLWSLLVEKYEEEHYPIVVFEPVKANRPRIE